MCYLLQEQKCKYAYVSNQISALATFESNGMVIEYYTMSLKGKGFASFIRISSATA